MQLTSRQIQNNSIDNRNDYLLHVFILERTVSLVSVEFSWIKIIRKNASRCKKIRQVGQIQTKGYGNETKKTNAQKNTENCGNKCSKEIGQIEIDQSCFGQGM